MSKPETDRHREPKAIPGTIMDVHFKLLGTDGVSLQSQELAEELRKRQWNVHLCASDIPADLGLQVPQLSYQTPDARTLRQSIFPPADGNAQRDIATASGAPLLERCYTDAESIKRQVAEYVDRHGIRLIHIRNIMSLPLNLPATLAFYQLATERPDIHFIVHHHDLMWEGPNARNFSTPYPQIADLIDRVICPNLRNATQVLINPIAARMLKEKRNITGEVIPDGFNFDRQILPIDETAFRRSLDILVGRNAPITEDDLIVGMMTRVAINKAIELAIQFVSRLQRERRSFEQVPDGVGSKHRRFTEDNRIVLLLGQGEDLGESREYLSRLLAYAESMGVTVAYSGNIVVPDSRYAADGVGYPFYSTYQAVDLVCYPTEHEGFGNQAIEAVWAKRPVAIHEYPVFDAYIHPYIPHFISLGTNRDLRRVEQDDGLYRLDEHMLDAAVQRAVALLCDPDQERNWTEENFMVLRGFCGIEQVADRYVQLYDRAQHVRKRWRSVT